MAVDEGGSSDKNIEEFVTEVVCKSKGIIEWGPCCLDVLL
jgi:pathogen-inducible salicylic acid glucosyltransferase